MQKREDLVNIYGELLFFDGLDDAIVEVVVEDDVPIVIYSFEKCIDLLIEMDMDYQDAIDYFYFNIEGCYVGAKTPRFIYENIEEYDDEDNERD